MKVRKLSWANGAWKGAESNGISPQLVLAFGNRGLLEDQVYFDNLKSFYPEAHILISSTSGEINGTQVLDESIVAAAVEFEHTRIKPVCVQLDDSFDRHKAGMDIAALLEEPDLCMVFVVSEGRDINGSELVRGLNAGLENDIPVTGGLAGDGVDFERTLVGVDTTPKINQIAAIGFYGDRLRFGFGSKGGWDAFGPERVITKSMGNMLYELDGQSALELYKSYLGVHAEELPGSGMRFPLAIRKPGGETLTRTLIGVNEDTQCMVFAGDVPEGWSAQLMRGNHRKLMKGAGEAARNSRELMTNNEAELAILISCVGRRLVLRQRTEEEVEEVRDVLGERPVILGFYSYGEISPSKGYIDCQLHNQTMTITTLSEV